jgi:hypothetical protein
MPPETVARDDAADGFADVLALLSRLLLFDSLLAVPAFTIRSSAAKMPLALLATGRGNPREPCLLRSAVDGGV